MILLTKRQRICLKSTLVLQGCVRQRQERVVAAVHRTEVEKLVIKIRQRKNKIGKSDNCAMERLIVHCAIVSYEGYGICLQ